MSHVAVIDLYIKEDELDMLEQACKILGLRLDRGRKTWRWYGRWVNDYSADQSAYNFGIKPEEYGKCADHVITIPGNNTAYEIGVVKRRDGKPGYMLAYDFWSGGKGMSEIVGNERCSVLKQAFTACVSCNDLQAKGFNTKVVTKADKKGYQIIATRSKTAVKR